MLGRAFPFPGRRERVANPMGHEPSCLHQPAFLLRISERPASERDGEVWLGRIKHFLRCEDAIGTLSRSPHITMMSVVPRRCYNGLPLCVLDEDGHAGTTNLLVGHFSTEDFNQKNGAYLKRFHSLLRARNLNAHDTIPSFAFFSHDFRNDTAICVNDSFGSGKIYVLERGRETFIASRPSFIIAALGKVPPRHEAAFHCLASFDWIVDDSYFFKGIRLVEPGMTLRCGKDARVDIESSHSIENIALAEGSNPDIPDDRQLVDVIEAARKSIEAASIVSRDLPSIGLSGGRDSRALVSIIEATREGFEPMDLRTRYHSKGPPQLEIEIGKQLADASRPPIDWQSFQHQYTVPVAVENLSAQASYWFRRFEGDAWPSFVRAPVPGDVPDRQDVGISGGGGEIARAHFYSDADIGNLRARRDAVLGNRRRPDGLLTKTALKVAADLFGGVMTSGADHGIPERLLLDWAYVRSQQRRRVPCSHNVTFVFPLLTPQLFAASFRMDNEVKINRDLVRQISGFAKPEWADIPFFSDVAHLHARKDVSKTQSVKFYWEFNRPALLDQLEVAISGATSYLKGTLDFYHRIERGDPLDAKAQNVLNRIFWFGAFKVHEAELADICKRDDLRCAFDAVSAHSDLNDSALR